MSRWIQVVAVALAAVVGLVPAFAQVGYVQALPDPVSVLPLGEELPDEELLEVEGEQVMVWLVATLAIGVLAGVRSCTRDKFSKTENAILDGITAAVSFGIGSLASQWSSYLSGFTYIPRAAGGGGWFEPPMMY